uniref:Endo-1,31,4-beta-D-glucanase n=1 Tax=Anthurium amnicola TaxID=1678845 RepID=A0A1D1ZHA9_9ARAE
MLSRDCCSNPPKLDPHCGLGTVVDDIAGLRTYTAGSPTSHRAILLVTDIYGYQAPNLRNIADEAAAAGFFVVAPDFYYGDPYVDGEPWDDWSRRHGTVKGAEDAKAVVAALRRGGATSIGAAGFCWGGKVVVELAKSDGIDAAVLLHPAMVTVDDIKEVEVPMEVLGGELDEISPPSLLKQFELILSTKSGIESFVKVFPGVPHGFSIRYDANDKFAVKTAEEAQQDMLNWFQKYVRWSYLPRGQKQVFTAAVKWSKEWAKVNSTAKMGDSYIITMEDHLKMMEAKMDAKMKRMEMRWFCFLCAALCISLVIAFLH